MTAGKPVGRVGREGPSLAAEDRDEVDKWNPAGRGAGWHWAEEVGVDAEKVGVPASARPTGFSDPTWGRGALCHGLPTLITDYAVDIGTARAEVEGDCQTPSHLQPAQETKAPTKPPQRLHSAWHPAHGAGGGVQAWGAFSAASRPHPWPCSPLGPRVACLRPLLTLTAAPAPIQALCGAGVLGHRGLALVPSGSLHPFPVQGPPSGPTFLAKSICPSG